MHQYELIINYFDCNLEVFSCLRIKEWNKKNIWLDVELIRPMFTDT